MIKTAKPRPVAFVLYDGVTLFDVAGPADVLASANALCGHPVYDLHFISARGKRSVKTAAGLHLMADDGSACPKDLDLLIIPGAAEEAAVIRARDNKPFIDWLAQKAERSARVASVCSGAFLVGALGLANKRRVTTHWVALDRLASDCPKARVERDALYVNDGNLWSSAGVSAGVDMMLAIVGRDLGPDVALKIARYMVLFLVRSGGQSQFSGPIDFQTKGADAGFSALIGWMESKLHLPLTVDDLAERAGLSVRTFHRRCRAVFAMTPSELLGELRLERARVLLSAREQSVKGVSGECGFASAAAFSKAFTHRFGTTPSNYRESFGASG